MMDFAEFMLKAAEGPPLVFTNPPGAIRLGPPVTRNAAKAARVAERERARAHARRKCYQEKRFDLRSYPGSSEDDECVKAVPLNPLDRASHRRQQLIEWKMRQKINKNIAPKSKPPFKVGVVPKDIGIYREPILIPFLRSGAKKINQSIMNSTQASIPSFAPKDAQFRPPIIRKRGEIVKELSTESQSSTTDGTDNTDSEKSESNEMPKTPKSKLQSSKGTVDCIERLAEKFEDACTTVEENSRKDATVPISPYVTVTRGKSKRPPVDPEYCEQSAEKTAQYFRLQLDSEIARLQDLCDTWRTYQASNTLVEDHQDLINVAICQTQLLISKKFQQFRGLVERCESKEIINGEGLVTVDDLQGFWDMVYMQVVNIDIRFNNLNKLRDNDWKEVEDAPVVAKPKKLKKAPVVKNSKGSSGLKAMILAARKSKQECNKTPIHLSVKPDLINFDGGFFAITSPIKVVKEDNLNTPVKSSIRNSVISSEAKKHIPVQSSSNMTALLRVSSVAKYVTSNDIVSPEVIPNVIPIDLNKTPARGILKTPLTNNKTNPNGSAIKKNVKILFADEDDDTDIKKVIEKGDDLPKEILIEDNLNMEEVDDNDDGASPVKSMNNIQKKTFKAPKRKVLKGATVKNENVSPLLEESENLGRRRSTRNSSVFKSPLIKILSSPNAIVPVSENVEDQCQGGSQLNESFFEVFGMSLKATRKSTRHSVIKSLNDCRASINLISFDSPVRPAYMTRSAIRKCSNVNDNN